MKRCPNCNKLCFGKYCPRCGNNLYYDTIVSDKYLAKRKRIVDKLLKITQK